MFGINAFFVYFYQWKTLLSDTIRRSSRLNALCQAVKTCCGKTRARTNNGVDKTVVGALDGSDRENPQLMIRTFTLIEATNQHFSIHLGW